MEKKHMMFTFILIGLMFSITIILAGVKGLLFDEIANSLSVEVWEIAYMIYLMFLLLGVVYSMVNEKPTKWNQSDFADMFIIVLLSVVSYISLQTIAIGDLSTAVLLMQTTNQDWWLLYAGIMAIYITNKFMVKR